MLKRTNKNRCLRPVSFGWMPDGVFFRCGKCANCLKHKGNELAVRVYNQSLSSKVCHWVTLTYDDQHCPIVEKRLVVDTWTGDILEESSLKFVDSQDFFFKNAPFVYRRNRDGRLTKRYSPLVWEEPAFDLFSERFVYRYELYFSTDMSFFQGSMKRFRHSLSEAQKKSFKYLAVPEYGGVGYRPHIHCVFTGLTLEELSPFLNFWKLNQGANLDIDTIDFSGQDDAQAIGRISSYVSKYASKGKFDCPYIFSGNCRKPRRCSSVGFGFGDEYTWNKIQSHLMAFDVYGKYDAFTPPVDVSPRLLASRRFCAIGDYPYPVPRMYLDRCFRCRCKVEKGTSHYVVLRGAEYSFHHYRVPATPLILYILYGKMQTVSFKYIKNVKNLFSTICKCSVIEPVTRYYTVSSPLSQEITSVVLADLCSNVEREREKVRCEIENSLFPSSFDSFEVAERLYRFSAERAFVKSVEQSVF